MQEGQEAHALNGHSDIALITHGNITYYPVPPCIFLDEWRAKYGKIPTYYH